MKKIVLLSDTHGFMDERFISHLKEADEIWHAGDIGERGILAQLSTYAPLKAVYGNIDGTDVRKVHPLNQTFMCENVKVFITHIGGYPNRYSAEALKEIQENKPQLFICGHSHILKVMYDDKYKLLHINPGAAGNHGFHNVKTMVRFTIDGEKIKDLEVVELGKRA